MNDVSKGNKDLPDSALTKALIYADNYFRQALIRRTPDQDLADIFRDVIIEALATQNIAINKRDLPNVRLTDYPAREKNRTALTFNQIPVCQYLSDGNTAQSLITASRPALLTLLRTVLAAKQGGCSYTMPETQNTARNDNNLNDQRMPRILALLDKTLQEGICLMEAGITDTPEFGKVRSLNDIFQRAAEKALDAEDIVYDRDVLSANLRTNLTFKNAESRSMKDASYAFNSVTIGDYQRVNRWPSWEEHYVFRSAIDENRAEFAASLRTVLAQACIAQQDDGEEISGETYIVEDCVTAPALETLEI